MEIIKVTKHDEIHHKIVCDPGTAYELNDYFSFYAPNYKFHPKYKARVWDGKIKMFSPYKKLLYTGLLYKLKQFCEERDYDLQIDKGLIEETTFTKEEAEKFINSLNLPGHIENRWYQIDSFVYMVQNSKVLLLSPTSSGKSLLIYWLIRYYNKKTLIVVDSLNLLHQLYSDFKDYNYDSLNNVHKVFSGQEKESDKQIFITTWQSAEKQPKEWFDQFEVVIGDEAHKYKAKSLVKIMESLPKCKYKFGLTGTLDGSLTNQLVIEGLFGKKVQFITNREMIDQNFSSDIKINGILLKYPAKQLQVKTKYPDEIKFLCKSNLRNEFIKKLALSLKGNTLIMFRIIEHGELLHSMLEKECKTHLFYVSGGVKGEAREDIRQEIKKLNSSITVASTVFVTGVDIPNIHNIICVNPTKAQVKTLQTIGRGLRKHKSKTKCILYDIGDDLSSSSWKNYSMKHFSERIKMFINEKFDYEIHNVNLKG